MTSTDLFDKEKSFLTTSLTLASLLSMTNTVPFDKGKSSTPPGVPNSDREAGSARLLTGQVSPTSGFALEGRQVTAQPVPRDDEQQPVTSQAIPETRFAIPRRETATRVREVGEGVPALDEHAERIIQVHFCDQILADLARIQTCSGTPGAAVYADSLLRTIRRMADVLPSAPIVQVLMALHDAMAFENRWARFSGQQYQAAHSLLKPFAHRGLSRGQVDGAIHDLEEAGFDTTPIPLDIAEED